MNGIQSTLRLTDGSTPVLELSGELDLSGIGIVERDLASIEAASPPAIVIDLRNVTFLDSTGLRWVIAADERARAGGRKIFIVRGPAPVHRVFEITNLDSRLAFVSNPSEIAP